MPDTAKLRGLADAFNPAEALYASARYLAELTRDYGNIGLAAAAYNGGEARVARFVAAKDGLPPETRAYVNAITGYPAETWRDAPPDTVDLSLDKAAAFQPACVAYAAERGGGGFRSAPPAPALGRGSRLEPRPRRPRAPGRAPAEPPRGNPAGRAGQLYPRQGRGMRARSSSPRSVAAPAPRPRRSAPGCAPTGGDCMVLRN